MTKSEKIAVNAMVEELVAEGVDKELAELMAKAYLDCGIIKPVVYFN